MLILSVGTASITQVTYNCGVGAVYEFVKCTTIIEEESELNLRANIFGTSNESDALLDNQLKNNHLLGVPLPSLYVVNIH